MKYCSRCGESLPDNVFFCTKCGAQQMSQSQPLQGQATTNTMSSGQPQYNTNSQSIPIPQAWIQCRNCNAMIPLAGQSTLYNCPVCGSSLAVPERKPNKWTVGRIILVASILLAFTGQFLPFLSFSFLGTTYSFPIWSEKFMGTAIIITFLLACCLLLAFVDSSKGTFACISSLIILFLLYKDYSYNQERLSDFDSGIGNMDLSGLLHPGTGLFLILIGCVGMIAACIAMHVNHQN